MATLLKVLNNLADIKSAGVLHFASELRVARVDGVLDVADQMGQTNLMLALGPAHLAGEAIRDPVIGPPFAQERLHDRLRAMGVGHEDGAVAMVEHPEPPIG